MKRQARTHLGDDGGEELGRQRCEVSEGFICLGTGANALDALNRSRVALLNDSQHDCSPRAVPVVGEDRTLARRPTPDARHRRAHPDGALQESSSRQSFEL